MKKMIKLSLVAAVAVAGLTTSASAQKLTDAIQGVDFSGMVEYRMEHRDTEAKNAVVPAASTNGENVKIVLKGKVAVNDSVTFNTVAVVNRQNASQGDSVASTQGAANINVAKFTYTSGPLAVTAGMQELATPWTSAGNGARANGILATYGMGSVTLAGAMFRDAQQGIFTNVGTNSANINAVAALGSAGPVNYAVWYAMINEENDATPMFGNNRGGLDALSVTLGGKFGPVSVDASYATLDEDGADAVNGKLLKQSLAKLMVSGKVGSVKLTAGLVDGGKDGELVSFTTTGSSAMFEAWNVAAGAGTGSNLNAYTLRADVPVGPVSVALQYTEMDFDNNYGNTVATTNTDVDEILAQVTYKMSKNFTTYLRYAQVDTKNTPVGGGLSTGVDMDRARLSLKYTF